MKQQTFMICSKAKFAHVIFLLYNYICDTFHVAVDFSIHQNIIHSRLTG